MIFEGIEQRLKTVSQVCDNPRIVIAGGGNYSEKTEQTMIIKGSGSYLFSLTLDDMVEVNRGIIRQALGFSYDPDPTKREAQYKEFLLKARLDQSGKRPSVETAVHEQLAKYVLHTHSTALTILSSVEETPELAKSWLGPQCLLMEYLDPGILLGIEAKRLLDYYDGMPKGIMQRNHGVFYNSDNFDDLIKMHNSVIKGIQERIDQCVRRKDEWPYGNIAVDFEKVTGLIRAPQIMKALYQAVFGKPAERANYTYTAFEEFPVHKIENTMDGRVEGVLYFYDSGLAREYAKSKKAAYDYQKFSWLTPDHIVSWGKHTDYIHLSDPTDIQKSAKEIVEQVKPHEEGLHARVYVIAGLGVATVGGHIPSDKEPEVKARYAMQFVNDALLVYQGTKAIGTLKRLTEANVDFIANWEVEKARSEVFQQRG